MTGRTVSVWLPAPSVNHYWGTRGRRATSALKGRGVPAGNPVRMESSPGAKGSAIPVWRWRWIPIRRTEARTDNILKAALDALRRRGRLPDDSQVDESKVRRGRFARAMRDCW